MLRSIQIYDSSPYRDKKIVGVFVRFSCAASSGKVIGLSKMNRIVRYWATPSGARKNDHANI
jgi:hypothetical protein